MEQQERVKFFNDYANEDDKAGQNPRKYLHDNADIYELLNYDQIDIDDLNETQAKITASSVAALKALNCTPSEFGDKVNVLYYYQDHDKDAGLSDNALEMIKSIDSTSLPDYLNKFIYEARGDWHAALYAETNEYIPNGGKYPTGKDAAALDYEIVNHETGETEYQLEQLEDDMTEMLG